MNEELLSLLREYLKEKIEWCKKKETGYNCAYHKERRDFYANLASSADGRRTAYEDILFKLDHPDRLKTCIKNKE